MSDLKPCLFCGGDWHGYLNQHHEYRVTCSNRECSLSGISFSKKAWNNRPAENKIKAEGVRGAADNLYCATIGHLTMEDTGEVDWLIEYANKLEGGS